MGERYYFSFWQNWLYVRVVQVLVVRFRELELRTLTPVRECRHGNQAHFLRPTKHVPGIERQALATHTHTQRERERERERERS